MPAVIIMDFCDYGSLVRPILPAVIIMDFCDYGSLVRPILKGMFRPISSSGNDREARVRYRALLRTAKEIAQVKSAVASCGGAARICLVS